MLGHCIDSLFQLVGSEVWSRLHPDHCEASARHRPPAQWDVQKTYLDWWEYDGNMIDLYWFILIYRLIILLTIGYITLNIKTQWCSIPMTDPWCCYIWCSMDPIIIYPSHVSIYNIYIYITAPWILWDMVSPCFVDVPTARCING